MLQTRINSPEYEFTNPVFPKSPIPDYPTIRIALPPANLLHVFSLPLAYREPFSGLGRSPRGMPTTFPFSFLPASLHSLINNSTQYKLYIITLAGDLLATFVPDADPGFGIRTVAWHPSGMFLAVGGWDDKVDFSLCAYLLIEANWVMVVVV